LLNYVETAHALEQSEADAVREQRFLDSLLASVPSAIAVVDDQQVITHVNPAFESMFGFAEAEVIGGRLENFIVRPADRESSLTLRSKAMEDGKLVAEAERLRKDGRALTTAIYAARVDAGLGAVLVVYEDITERRMRERRTTTLNAVADVLTGHAPKWRHLLRIAGRNFGWKLPPGGGSIAGQGCALMVWVAPATWPDLADFIRGSRQPSCWDASQPARRARSGESAAAFDIKGERRAADGWVNGGIFDRNHR
jgi:PAS domain S-box-containing protein